MLQILSEACRDTIASTTCKQTIAIKFAAFDFAI